MPTKSTKAINKETNAGTPDKIFIRNKIPISRNLQSLLVIKPP
jgi:hypothetical protein